MMMRALQPPWHAPRSVARLDGVERLEQEVRDEQKPVATSMRESEKGRAEEQEGGPVE
jgi:hypothetical protein